ncbi:MAG TPA: Fe-S cluster assembly scaffold protein NifU [Firmicutes bacterium]|nr:Fe-S cluster assembly scaffold protein NifU [Bacillota bacterium]
MYSEKVMAHFSNPKFAGEIPDANGVGQEGNPVCGDIMKIYLKVEDGRIADIKFKTFGCGAAIATSDMVCEMVLGKTLDEALRVSNQAVAEALDGLPPNKLHCSNLAADALHRAIEDYYARHGGPAPVQREATIHACCGEEADCAGCPSTVSLEGAPPRKDAAGRG